jgi:hypothetical protein
VRQKQEDQLNYYVLNLINLKIITDIASSDSIEEKDQNQKFNVISSFIKIEKLKISLSKQKNYGPNNLKML